MESKFQTARILVLLGVLPWLSACQSLQFYQQAIVGQTKLLLARQPAAELAATSPDPALRERLELVQELLSFAEAEGLPVRGSFSSYVETGQPYIVWNVFAAKPFELALKQHCFLIAGCVSYRGYFREEDARTFAARLESQGYETYVAGVAAYSTLGWFNDPLLDTFLFRGKDRLAALIFHELAHQLVYVPGDTRFNESVATAVEHYLLRKWLQQQNADYLFDAYLASQARRQEVLDLIEATRVALRSLYESDTPPVEKAARKQQLFDRLRADYATLRADWGEGSEFQAFMQGAMNNAKLETVADYNAWVPGLSGLLEASGMAGFQREMERLAKLDSQAREGALTALTAAKNTRG